MKINNSTVSQALLIREMGSTELVEYASKLESTTANQILLKKCIACYLQLTGKDLLVELNKLNKEDA